MAQSVTGSSGPVQQHGWLIKEDHTLPIFIIQLSGTSGGKLALVFILHCQVAEQPHSLRPKDLALPLPAPDCGLLLMHITTGYIKQSHHLHNLLTQPLKGLSHIVESEGKSWIISCNGMLMYIGARSVLVTDSTSSMYGPRTGMGVQVKKTSLGVLWYKNFRSTFTIDFSNSPTCRHRTGSQSHLTSGDIFSTP